MGSRTKMKARERCKDKERRRNAAKGKREEGERITKTGRERGEEDGIQWSEMTIQEGGRGRE